MEENKVIDRRSESFTALTTDIIIVEPVDTANHYYNCEFLQIPSKHVGKVNRL